MDEDATIPSPSPFKLMNFVSQEQLEESKKARGERVEDGTAQRDRPLYEILKENKDKKDAEFNERFKHRPPKALDEDETEFLDNLEMSKREYEQQMASEEAQQLRSFQEAVAAHSSIVYELKEAPSAPKVEGDSFISSLLSQSIYLDKKPVAKKNRQAPLGGVIISVKPQAKKAKIDSAISEKPLDSVKPPSADVKKSQDVINGSVGNLVSYSDESEDDDS